MIAAKKMLLANGRVPEIVAASTVAGSTLATMPPHQKGDMLIGISTYRSQFSSSSPDGPDGWTQAGKGSVARVDSEGFARSPPYRGMTISYKIAQSSAEVSGQWEDRNPNSRDFRKQAEQLTILVVRGGKTVPKVSGIVNFSALARSTARVNVVSGAGRKSLILACYHLPIVISPIAGAKVAGANVVMAGRAPGVPAGTQTFGLSTSGDDLALSIEVSP